MSLFLPELNFRITSKSIKTEANQKKRKLKESSKKVGQSFRSKSRRLLWLGNFKLQLVPEYKAGGVNLPATIF